MDIAGRRLRVHITTSLLRPLEELLPPPPLALVLFPCEGETPDDEALLLPPTTVEPKLPNDENKAELLELLDMLLPWELLP